MKNLVWPFLEVAFGQRPSVLELCAGSLRTKKSLVILVVCLVEATPVALTFNRNIIILKTTTKAKPTKAKPTKTKPTETKPTKTKPTQNG